jgi:hypothetical protein
MLRVHFFSLRCQEMITQFPPARVMTANIPSAGIFAAARYLSIFLLYNNENRYYWGTKQRAD